MTDFTNPSGSKGLSVNLIPNFFKTDANKRFLQATVDQLVAPGTVKKVNGFVGRPYSKSTTGTDLFVEAPTLIRQNYQLEPALTVQDTLGNTTFFKDYIDYINQLSVFGANVSNHARLNKQEFYSWNPHIDWDKFVNFQNYYWLSYGPDTIKIFGQQLTAQSTYKIALEYQGQNNQYVFTPDGLTPNPAIKLYRGQTYKFIISSPSNPISIKTARSTGVADRYQIAGIDSYGVENGVITVTIPVNSPNILYYQSETDINAGGVFEIYNIDENSFIDVDAEILGKVTYTLSDGTALSNGMKVSFGGQVSPSEYETGEYYVEGVGTAIRLIEKSILEISTTYTESETLLFDSNPFDVDAFSDSTGFAKTLDYMVINRASQDHNPWSRYNRWFHKDVITASAVFNKTIASLDQSLRAVRPIIEFNADLKLFNFGTDAIFDIDLVDSFTTDAFSTIEGSLGYSIDGISLSAGQNILFLSDTDRLVKNKIFKVEFINVTSAGANQGTRRQIHLVELHTPTDNEVVLVKQGKSNQGVMYWFNGDTWISTQQKTNTNQFPLFDVVDLDGISFSNTSKYDGTTFKGTYLFSYKINTTGTIDTNLGFALSYRNIENIGDIVFDFNFDTDTFSYRKAVEIVDVPINTGYVVTKDYAGNTVYKNAWEICTAPNTQAGIRIYKNSNQTNNFKVDIFDDVTKLSDLTVHVYVNSHRIASNQWMLIERPDYKTVKLNADILETDVLTIKTYASQPINTNGFYEIPLNLQHNPLNSALTTLTLGEVIDHVDSIVDGIYATTDLTRTLAFIGTFPGASNLRDLGNITPLGTKFVQHSSPASISLYHVTTETNNVIRAIQESRDKYIQFKKNFLAVALNLGIETTPAKQVDLILEQINKDKSKTDPYYFSDMVPYRAGVKTNITVVDSRIKTYPLKTTFTLDTLSNNAVIVYVNDLQLIYQTDYYFSEQGFIVISYALAENDTISITEYNSTDGSFIPETPTKLGMWPKYKPMLYLDTTLVTPRWMIQGHDGSHILAYGTYGTNGVSDYRDAIILELEKRIFNNIKVAYNTEIFDIAEILPSYNRPGDYSRTEFNQVLAPSFYQWSSLVDKDFTKPLSFDRNNPFTFKYSSFSTLDGQETPGYWRGIYQWIYDTDRPHLCPWEMLGFSMEPTWWQSLYGPAPYTSDNLVMWQDISQGVIRATGVPAVQTKKYIKLFLLKHLPVDSAGNLVNPLVSGFIKGTITAHSQTDFVFGDGSPVETAWRRSSHYAFSIILTSLLLKPSDTFGKLLDRARIIRNLCGQIIYSETGLRIRSEDIKLPSIYSSDERVQTSGIINYITNYILSDNLKSYNTYTYDLTYLNTKLSYRVGAFTSKEKFKLLLDSKSPMSTSSVFVPPEDYTVILNSSSPIKKLTYSGVIVSKLADGYEIKGYSRSTPYFKYYQYQQSGITINIGGISENFVAWTANEQFGLGQVVKYNNQYFRSTSTHTASNSFNDSYYEALPRLPIIGGRDAVMRKSWDKSIINTSPYGTKFEKIQEVVDFLLGYGEWLKDEGFIFDEFNPILNAVTNWETSAKEFLFWTTQNWSTGQEKWEEWTSGMRITYGDIVRYNGDYFKSNKNSVSPTFLETDFTKLDGLDSNGGSAISLSPSAAKLTFKTELSVIDDIRNPFNGYEIFKVDGTPLEPTFINSYREDNAVSYSPRSDDGIYGATFYLIQQEHVVLLNNITIFNDTIFKPETGYKQDRIKVSGYVSTNWYGGLDIPGFILDVAKIQNWTPWEDYDLGDIVKYKQFYYTASRFLPGSVVFVNEDWILLDKKPVTQLLPNWTYKAEQFTDFYSLDSDNFDTAQQQLAQHLIGYQKRQYLTNIIKDDVSEFKFYQGMIREKGTQNSLNKLFDVKSALGEESLTFYEEWAIRTGQYGASEAFESIEFVLDESKIRSNPQGFYLSENLDDPNDFIITYNSNQVYLKPVGYASNPWPVLTTYQPYLRSAGYFRSDEVYTTIKSLDDILLANPTTFQPNIFVAITFEGIGWNVYKYIDSNVSVTNVDYSNATKTLTITLSELVDFTVGSYIGIDQVDSIKGFYKIVSVSLNTFTVSATISNWTPPFTQSQNIIIFKFVSQRAMSMDLVDSLTRPVLIPGDKLWIDSDSNNKWAVWEYAPVYSRKLITNSSPADGANYGKIISCTKLGKIIAIGSNSGDTEIWDKSGYNSSWIQRQLVTKPFVSYLSNASKLATVIALSFDGKWLATGSPLASNAYTKLTGNFNTSTAYVTDDIVYVGNSGAYTGFYQALQNNTNSTMQRPDGVAGLIPNVLSWKKIKYVSTLLNGTSSGLSEQGVISLYSKDANNIFTLVDTIVSPFPTIGEKFGSQLAFANDILYISATGYNSSAGRVYKLAHSVDVQATTYYNPVGSEGTTLKVTSTVGVLPGMLIAGVGFTSKQIVSAVINTTTLTISQQPDITPTGLITFSTVGWGFDLSSTLSGDVADRQFGSGLVTTDDNSTLVVTANNNTLSGQVKIYKSGVLSQTITGTNLNFGKSVDISNNSNYLIISDSLTDNEMPKSGSVNVYKLTASAFVLYQTLKNHKPENSGYFGSKVSFIDDYKTIVVYSSDEDTILQTIFDENTTIFDKDSTNISQLATESGRIDVYDMYETKWIYSETLENLQTAGSGFGQGLATGNNHIIVTAPFEFDQNLQSGIVIDYEKKENTFSWNVKHQQINVPDTSKVKSAFLYNKATGELVKYIDVIDLAQGKIAGPAREEIKYSCYYDPAIYSVSNSNDDVTTDAAAPWGKSQVGYIWWDLRTTKLIDAYDDSVVYRNSVWNSLAVGASVDLYEWVESALLPLAWDTQADTEAGIANGISGKSLYGNNVYSIKERFDTSSQTKKYTYYYWVKNKKTIPNISSRNLSAIDVASLIENPRGSAYTYLALTGSNSFSIVNAANYLQDANVVLSVEYWTVANTSQNIHSQWKIINNDSATVIPTHLEQKWFDSLCGKDAMGRDVPDLTLAEKLRYGVENRPRQGMFINRFEALKQLIEETNAVLLANPVVDSRNISNIDVKESVPNLVLGLYDTTQDTSEELRFVNVGAFRRPVIDSCTIVDGKITGISISYAGRGYLVAPYISILGSGEGAIVRTILNSNGTGQIVGVTIVNPGEGYDNNTVATIRDYSVLITNDSEAQGVWSVYSYDPVGKVWSRTKSQSYDVTAYWNKADWFAVGYNQFTAIDHAVDMVSNLKTLNDSVGQIIKVRTTTTGWSLLEKISNVESFDYTQMYKVVGLENGTIQLSPALYKSSTISTGYDGTTYDGISFDNSPNLELRIILESLKNDIFTDDLKINYLNLFFTTVRYALSEQVYLDWIFKTSFIKARHNVGQLSTPVTYNNDNLSNFQDYIDEVKPFKSKIREYVSSYQLVDPTPAMISDFDLPPIYRNNAITTISTNINSGVITADDATIRQYPWKNWLDNVGFIVIDIKIINGGSGYVGEPVVKIINDSGSGATARAFFTNGVINRIIMLTHGSGYLAAPSVSIVGGLSSTGVAARAVAIIGNSVSSSKHHGVVRSSLIKIKFDRITSSYFFVNLEETEFINATGNLQYKLTYAPDVTIGLSTVTINNIPILRENYKLTTVTTTTDYTKYSGLITFAPGTQPAVGQVIKIVYLKNQSLLNAADRIHHYYNPQDGDIGNDLSQLMTGVDYGGVIIQGLGFEVSAGWGTTPWFTDKWDSFDPLFDDYILTVAANTRSFTLPYTPSIGTKINTYYVGLNLTTIPVVTDVLTYAYTYIGTNPIATLTRNVLSGGTSTNYIPVGTYDPTSVIVKVASVTGISPGMSILGTGFTSNQIVLLTNPATNTVTLSASPNVQPNGTLYFTKSIAGSATLSLSSTVGLQVGDSVSTSSASSFGVDTVIKTILNSTEILLNQIIYVTVPTASTILFTRPLNKYTDIVISSGFVNLTTSLISGSVINITSTLPSIKLDDENFGTPQQTNASAVIPTFIGNGNLNIITIPNTFVVAAGDKFILRKSTSDGSLIPQDTDYDSLLIGGDINYATASGLNADDILIDGDGFITPTSSPAPEEVVPGQVVDTVAIKVYDQPNSGSANIKVDNFIGNSLTNIFKMSQAPNSAESIVVKKSNVILNSDQYTVDYRNREVTLLVVPATGEIVSIYNIGFNGNNILDIDYFVSDGATTEFITKAPWLSAVTNIVYVDGVVATPVLFQTDASYETANRVALRFATAPATNALINYIIVSGNQQTFAITKKERIVTTGTNTYTLAFPVGNNLPAEANMIVRVNQNILPAPISSYFTIKNNKLSYKVDSTKIVPYSTPITNILIIVGTTVLKLGTDYTVDPGGLTIKINKITYATYVNKTLVVTVNSSQGYVYNPTNNTIVFSQAYTNSDLVEIISSYNHDILDIQRTAISISTNLSITQNSTEYYTYKEALSGLIALDRTVISDEYVWVVKNNTLLTPSVDYKLNDNKQSIQLATKPAISDIFTLITFGNNVLGSSVSYMQFKDMLNRVHFKRLSKNKQTQLTQPLIFNDTTITVEDASNFDVPNAAINRPGIIEIRGERIEYFGLVGNMLSKLRRGTLGTGVPAIHNVGTLVQDIGPSETLPYTESSIIQQAESAGLPVINLNFVPTKVVETAVNFTIGRQYKIVTLGTTDWNTVANTSGVLYAVGNLVTTARLAIGTGTAISTSYGQCDEIEVFIGGYNIDTVWASGISYVMGAIVISGSYTYQATVNHTSKTTFKQDYDLNYWKLFVGNTRLKKTPYIVHHELQSSVAVLNPSNLDQLMPAEFTVDGVSAAVKLTTPVDIGVKVTVVKRMGTDWDSTLNIQYDSGAITEFLKATPGIWYNRNSISTTFTGTFDNRITGFFDSTDNTFE
jgi:hypothetical protein